MPSGIPPEPSPRWSRPPSRPPSPSAPRDPPAPRPARPRSQCPARARPPGRGPDPLRELHARAGVPYRPTQHIRELGTLLCMVEAGLGVAVVPSLAGSMLPGGLTLVPVLPRVERRLLLTGPATRPWHPHVTAIRDLCQGTGPVM
ncbi:LysR substrate-binding domain-containing protein [Streptomyces sp. PA03-5A]|nr:LysR substrate-binding domain-containing protein [Streptomyces sp. PA03-5A]